MYISHLKLVGYRPLSLSNIKVFEYSPERALQLILGTNGSGKSSLLRALTPTVSDSAEFNKGGSKLIHLEDDGRKFELLSTYNSSIKHSFKIDGVEQNPGGTGKVQTELVATHLNYTKYLHTLLTGELGFCKMSRGAREDLLLDISGADFSYALDLFSHLKQSHRDVLGATKHLTVKYNELSSRLDNLGDASSLEAEAEELEHEIARLVPYSNWSATGTDSIKNKIHNTEAELQATVAKSQRVIERIKCYTKDMMIESAQFENHDAFNEAMIAYGLKSKDLQARIQELNKELSDVSSIVRRLDECPESLDMDSLEEHIESLEQMVKAFVPSHLCTHSTPMQALESLNDMFGRFSTFMDGIPSGIRAHGKEEISACAQRYTDHTQAMNRNAAELKRLVERKHHADLAREGDTVCPNCDTRIVGTSSLADNRYQDLLNAIERGKTSEVKLAEEFVPIEAAQTSAAQFEGLCLGLVTLVKRYPVLRDLVVSVGSASSIVLSPLTLLSAIRKELSAVKLWAQDIENKSELDKHKEYRYLLKLSQTDNTVSRFSELEKALQETHITLDNTKNAMVTYGKLKSMYDELRELSATADCLMERQARELVEWANAEGTQMVTDHVRQIQSQAGALRHAVMSWNDLVMRKEHLETEERELKDKRKGLENLLKALSPATGLIGQQLRETINAFAGRVNGIIEQIWEHDLQLIVPQEKSLSYRFNLNVNGELREDIKKGSTGEQDVIDLAVTLVIMAQKKLQGYPLFLDEVGSSFDEMHRKRFMELVNTLVNTGQVSQMFLINHFSGMFGGLANADVVALNTNNVSIAGEYNKVVKMS